jgi:hypothetical protein
MDGSSDNLPQRPVDQLISGLCGAIAALREENRALAELAQSRGDDAESLRLVLRQALTTLHDEQQAHARLRIRHKCLVTEYRERLKRETLERAA